MLVLSALVRCLGLAYGLPAVHNPDEVAIMNRAVGLAQTQFNPRNFLYPSLYFYALFACEALWFVAGRLLGMFGSLAAFERAFFVDPTSIYLVGRGLTAACGVLTVWATAHLGARLWDARAGLSAAVLLGLAPLAVTDAHYVKHDVPVTLLIVLAHLALLRAWSDPARSRRWILVGLLTGLAMSTHYYAVFVTLPVAIGALSAQADRASVAARVRRLLLVGGAAALVFFAGSPFLLLEPMRALDDISANRAIVIDRLTTSTGAFGAAEYYLGWLARDAAGRLACVLAAGGLIVTLRSGARTAIVALAFSLAFIAFIANTVPASRYLNPVLPFMLLLAGAAVSWTLRHRRRIWRVAGVALLAGAGLEAGWSSVRVGLFFRQADTRTLAQQWIERTLPEGTSILVQPYSVQLRQSRGSLEEALRAHLGDPARASVKFTRLLRLDPYPSPAYRTLFLGAGGLDVDKIYVEPAAFDQAGSLEPLRRLAVTCVVMKRYNVEDVSMVAISAALRREGRLAAVFSPYRHDASPDRRQAVPPFLHNSSTRIAAELERPGPIVEIWTID
ncbi:MAG: glycosyltransferase family 39 protein [Acidobacteria bacterium]|nr:glycosyltransferase family 39 protein [Acidobacteriota bacterium]